MDRISHLLEEDYKYDNFSNSCFPQRFLNLFISFTLMFEKMDVALIVCGKSERIVCGAISRFGKQQKQKNKTQSETENKQNRGQRWSIFTLCSFYSRNRLTDFTH